MTDQLQFLSAQSLRYDKEQVLAIHTFTGWNNDGARLVEIFRNELAGREEI